MKITTQYLQRYEEVPFYRRGYTEGLTRKSSCMYATGIPPAACQALTLLLCLPGGVGGTPIQSQWGEPHPVPIEGYPHPDPCGTETWPGYYGMEMGYPPPPRMVMTNKLKTVPSRVLRIRAVKNIQLLIFMQKFTGAPFGQPEIEPELKTLGINSVAELTCNTDQMDEGNPGPSYTIWTKVFNTAPILCCFFNFFSNVAFFPTLE